jgi:hypothetical protein
MIGNMYTVLTPGSSLSYEYLFLALLYGRIIIERGAYYIVLCLGG